MNFRRQPKKVVVTIEGEKPDVDKTFHELISRFSVLPYSVDFEVTPDNTKIILFPWAVND